MKKKSNKILIIEKNSRQAKHIEEILKKNRYECSIAHSIESAIEVLNKQKFFLALIDLNLPNGDACRLMEYINQCHPSMKIIILSSKKNHDAIIKSFKMGAIDHLIKPIRESNLLKAVDYAKQRKGKGLPLFQRNLRFIEEKMFLTPKEYQILELIISGINYRDISEKLSISHLTLKVHLKNIFRKLKLGGKTEIVYYFYCHDLSDLLRQLYPSLDEE